MAAASEEGSGYDWRSEVGWARLVDGLDVGEGIEDDIWAPALSFKGPWCPLKRRGRSEGERGRKSRVLC